MNGFEKRTSEKKEAILVAARELFARCGIRAVSISEIAKAAHVSQVSIYNYYGDKNSLAREALLSFVDTAISGYNEIMARDIPFGEKMELILRDKEMMIGSTATAFFTEQALNDEVLQKVFGEVTADKAAALYLDVIGQGRREGAIDAGIPEEAVLRYVLTSVSLLQKPEVIGASAAYRAGMIQLFLHGLLKRPCVTAQQESKS